MERRAGFHAVGGSFRGPLHLRSGVLPGQHFHDVIELFEHVLQHRPTVGTFEQIGRISPLFGFDVDVFVHDHHVAEVHQQTGIETGPVETCVPQNTISEFRVHLRLDLVQFRDDLVASVDRRICIVPHGRRHGIGAVERSVGEAQQLVAVGEVVGDGIQCTLVGAGPLQTFLRPEHMEQEYIEVHFELFGCLKPVSCRGLILRIEIQIAACQESRAANRSYHIP